MLAIFYSWAGTTGADATLSPTGRAFRTLPSLTFCASVPMFSAVRPCPRRTSHLQTELHHGNHQRPTDQRPGRGHLPAESSVRNLLDQLAEIVGDALENDGEITLPGIGKLKVSERPARTGRNPQTGKAIEIAAKKVVKLVPAKALTDGLN